MTETHHHGAQRMATSTRDGVALVIALVILAALLLLGLPFLFSQSESLAGSRSLAYHQSTAVGLTNGEQLAAAAVAEGMQHHLEVDGDAYTRQHDDLLATALMQTDGIITDNTFALDTSSIATGGKQARSGAWIEDEHGKLNPNYLSPHAWTTLLREVGIQDWDDDLVLDSRDHRLDDNPLIDEDGKTGLSGDPNHNGDNDDGNDFGELAEALANVRFSLPGRHITHLDQLLLADPGHNDDDGPNGTDYQNLAMPTGSYGFRRPLTRAELDRLRPYLTLHTPAPGREGTIDLGNMVAQKTYIITHSDGVQTEEVSYVLLDDDPFNYIRTGSAATWPEVDAAGERYQFSRVHGLAARDYSTSLRLDTFPASAYADGRAVALSAPPRVNLHHALDPVAAALQTTRLPAIVTKVGLLDPAPFLRIDPLSTGVELPPIGIASKGVVAVTAGAAAADQLGRVAAERHRRTVLQAVPTQIDLEERWRYQDEFHALVAQRYASRMVTWPEPTQRINGRRPSMDASAPDRPVGLGVAPLPSLATGYLRQRETDAANREPSHLNIDFRVPLGADMAIPEADLATGLFADRKDVNDPKVSVPGATTADAGDLRPDGLRITGSFTWRSAPPGGSDAVVGPLRPVNLNSDATADRSLTGRHVSFWFKPHNTWEAPGAYPLLELRSPANNLGARIDGTPGSNELQNRLSVVYDRERQLLLAIIAPPIIEHPVDWGPQIPFDDLNPLTSAHLDERTLGDPAQEAAPYLSWAAPWNRLAPLAPQQPYPDAADLWDEGGARFTAQVSRLYKPNTIVHVTRLADPDRAAGGGTQPFFRKDRWYHFQLVHAGDGPGEVLTIIDGVVGQDVSRNPPVSVDAMQTGDRLTLPAMPLVTLLPPMIQPVPSGGGAFYAVDRIEVAPVLGLQAADLFPQRGMLRINDEYIAYERIDGNAFLNCQRGLRQNSMTNNADVVNQWPLVQEHLPETLVVPGGFRMPLSSGILYRGGSRLAEPLANGDPDNSFLIWGRVDHTGSSVRAADAPLDSTHLTLPLAEPGCLIDLTTMDGVPTQFPNVGIARLGSQYFIYTRDLTSPPGSFRMRVVSSLETMGASPKFVCLPDNFTFPPLSNLNFLIPNAANLAPDIHLVGLPLQGEDPTIPFNYKTDLDNGGEFLMQFRHPGGRVEWASYSNIGKARDDNVEYANAMADYAAAVQALAGAPPPDISGFLLNRAGWGKSNRGRERTDFAGKIPEQITRLSAAFHVFPPDSLLLPVQTELGTPAHWIATGDVISLVPRVAESGIRPIQVIVRYATTDGLDTTGNNSEPDTKNEYFAFDHFLPTALTAAGFEMLAWPGWSGLDLTPMNPRNGLRGAPPRFDLAAPGADPRAGIELAFLSRHPEGIVPAAADALRAGDPLSSDATIDALVGGQLDGPFFNPGTRRGLVRGLSTSGEVLTDLATVGAVVEASHTNFFPRPFGLVAIQGEVFAYRQLRDDEASARGITNAGQNQHAMLIGRGLLDLSDPAPTVVSLPHGPMRGAEVLRPLVPAIPLPIGPVAQLTVTITDHQFFTLDTGLHQRGSASESIAHGNIDAPAVLIAKPDGVASGVTMVGLAGGARVRRVGSMPPNIIHDTEYVTAPWLRGLYNTNPAAAGQAGDIVIGWWPRLPSARPAITPPGEIGAALHRSRRFAWVGFPMAMHGARFDPFGAPASVQIDNEASKTDDLLRIEARAAALRDHDWTRGTVLQNVFGFGALPSLGTLFSGHDFSGPEVSGAELRVSWRYADDIGVSSRLDAIAEAGSRGPFISSAFLRWRAPMAVLAVEEAR